MKKLKIYTFLLLLFCFCGKISAQKKLDSILDATIIKIYENPNAAIETSTAIFQKAEDLKTKVNALMLISNAYLSKRENEKSLEYALKARDYLPEIESVKTKINVLNTIGMQHQQLRIYDKAIEYLDEALALAENFKQQDSIITLLGYNYAARGFIYRERMSCDIALNYFDKSIVQYKKGGNEKTRSGNLSTLYYNKGNCMLRLSKIDSARANFEKSIHYAQTVDAKSLYAFAKKGLSEVYTAEGNYTEAITLLKEAEKASENVGDLILNQGIYKNLSDNYLAVNNAELYTVYFEKSNTVQNQINEKEQKTINNSISNLITENKTQTESELSKLQNYRWILLALVVILLFVWGNFILKNFKNYKKSKEKLEALKK
tara:strand:- start:1126 stop:2250 length:1125 start_codon:yes stop_codon:yes gene_type:complete